MKKLILLLLSLALCGCGKPCTEGYKIEIPWGDDKWAGTDYAKAQEMAKGAIVYPHCYTAY